MNGRRKRILTSLGSLSFATLLAEIAFKRQLDKDLQKEMQGAGEKRNSPSEKWNSPRNHFDVKSVRENLLMEDESVMILPLPHKVGSAPDYVRQFS